MKETTFHGFFRFGLAFLTALLCASPPPLYADGFTVRTEAFASSEDTARYANELKTKKLPVLAMPSGLLNSVTVGPFRNYLDAWLVMKHLGRAEGRSFQVEPFEATADSFADPLMVIPPFFTVETASAAELPFQSLRGNSEYEKLEALDTNKRDKSVYEAALLSKAPKIDDTDPLKGYIYVNLGIVEILKAGARDACPDERNAWKFTCPHVKAALDYLEPVANGRIASAASHRVMAMRRVAWLTHQSGDRVGAYKAYRQLEQFSHSADQRDLCKVECIGLLMELAECEVGTHEDVRREVEKVLAELPQSNHKQRALAELMYLETFARQPKPDNQRAAELGAAFLEKYQAMGDNSLQRELAAACFQTGFFYERAGKYELARLYFKKVFDDFPHDVETFRGNSPHAQALNGLAILAVYEGDNETKEQVYRDLIELYPDLLLTKRIKADYPHLETKRPPSQPFQKENHQ